MDFVGDVDLEMIDDFSSQAFEEVLGQTDDRS